MKTFQIRRINFVIVAFSWVKVGSFSEGRQNYFDRIVSPGSESILFNSKYIYI